MKRMLLAIIAISGAMTGFAQDSTSTRTDTATAEKVDTIRVGGMIILKKKGTENHKEETVIEVNDNRKRNHPNITTNWGILDLGFANVYDNTNYAAAQASGFVDAGVGKDQLNYRNGKSVNVNIWFFMQRLNLVKHVVKLQYGLGLELNNYHFDEQSVRLLKNPTKVILDSAFKGVDKNKLAADYITIPMMLNFNFTPGRERGFGLSAGVSAGYLYSARQKTKEGGNVSKYHDDFDLRSWKISYIGELNLGPVILYGSYATQSMWEKGLDQTPYTVGIRLSHW